MIIINSPENLDSLLKEKDMVLGYFTSTNCNMCKDLFPKVEAMVEAYPELAGVRVEVDKSTAFVGAYSILTVPTMVLFVQGKETIRRSRQISLLEFAESIERFSRLLS